MTDLLWRALVTPRIGLKLAAIAAGLLIVGELLRHLEPTRPEPTPATEETP